MTKDASGAGPAIPKILPKPKELMPGEEARDEAIVQTFNTNGLSPHVDPDDPDVRAAQNEYEAAQKRLREVSARKAMLKLVDASDDLDPDKVAELCEKEPWKKGGIEHLSKSLLGFVPEKFEALALKYPEGSPEYVRYMAARDKGREIYSQQMKVLLRQIWARFDADGSVTNKRELSEPLSNRLKGFAWSLQDNPVYEQQYGRVMWLCMNVGEVYMDKYGKSKASGRGYQQWSITPSGMDDPEPLP